MPWYADKGEPREQAGARSLLAGRRQRPGPDHLARRVRLWFVGTDTAKDLLHDRLQVTTPGPGYEHHSKHLPDAFSKGSRLRCGCLCAPTAASTHRWVKPAGARNEPLDCTVYGMWCSNHLGLHASREAWAQPRPGCSRPVRRARSER